MGSGNRFEWSTMPGIALGVQYHRWPFQHTLTVQVLCFSFQLGFGPGYDHLGYKQ
jgi:hypothetical protein